jgi:predicted Rossmann-fold nucleotide-binding protein
LTLSDRSKKDDTSKGYKISLLLTKYCDISPKFRLCSVFKQAYDVYNFKIKRNFAKRSEILAKYCMVYTIVRQNFGSFSEICEISLNFNIINIVALFIYTTKTKFWRNIAIFRQK